MFRNLKSKKARQRFDVFIVSFIASQKVIKLLNLKMLVTIMFAT